MGQRVAIILKKNFKDKAVINVIHHQWGIGKVLGSLFLQELLKAVYPLDRNLDYDYSKAPIEKYFTFEPLSNEHNNYIFNKEVAVDDKEWDIWDKKVRVRLGNMTDNNNGLMLVELTQKYDEEGKALTYGDCYDVKISFTLGYEETGEWSDKLIDKFEYENDFERLVSIKEYVNRTFASGIENGSNKAFIDIFNKTCNLFGVEQVYDKWGERKRKELERKATLLIDHLYKENKCKPIPVPKELLEHKSPNYL